MKTIIKFSLIILIAYGQIYAGGKNSAKFYKHNSKAGFRALELKSGHTLTVEWNEKFSTPSKVLGGLTAPGYASENKSAAGKKFIKENKQLFGIKNPEKELIMINEEAMDGKTKITYQQRHGDLKINSAWIELIFNEDGSIESFNGYYYPSPEVESKFEVTVESAARNAVNSLPNSTIKDFAAEYLLILANDELIPVYLISITSSQQNTIVYVNGMDGSIISEQLSAAIN